MWKIFHFHADLSRKFFEQLHPYAVVLLFVMPFAQIVSDGKKEAFR